ncbi:MAG: hypothetical protein ACD_77C00143G0015 [uncultured bacterium]|nr:MAG: hypothetical protein ACD_77C00143G0015 [uncultured bacterium]HBY01416.1 hypothetical protein [Rikenellaceae bacterium]
MKRVFFSLAILMLLPLIVKADPPKKINLSYNAETQKLKIEAVHPVPNTVKHYIDVISIYVDGKEVKVLNLQKQSDKQAEIIEVEIKQIVSGSEVTVKARCNEFGSKKVSKKF